MAYCLLIVLSIDVAVGAVVASVHPKYFILTCSKKEGFFLEHEKEAFYDPFLPGK